MLLSQALSAVRLSTSSTDDELSEAMLAIPTYQNDLARPEVNAVPNPEPDATDLGLGHLLQGLPPAVVH